MWLMQDGARPHIYTPASREVSIRHLCLRALFFMKYAARFCPHCFTSWQAFFSVCNSQTMQDMKLIISRMSSASMFSKFQHQTPRGTVSNTPFYHKKFNNSSANLLLHFKLQKGVGNIILQIPERLSTNNYIPFPDNMVANTQNTPKLAYFVISTK